MTTIRPDSGEEAIKASLRERMKNSKNLVVLVGKSTKNLRKYVPWEIEIALKANLPVIVVNIDGGKQINKELCPSTIKEELAIHIPFAANIMQYALDNWPSSHLKYRSENKSGPFHYNSSVYDQLK